MDKFEIEQFSQLGDIIDELQFCFLDEDAYSRTPSPHEWRRATAIVHRLKLAFCELLGYAKACRQFTMEFTRERLHVVPGDKGGDPEQGQEKKDPDAGTSGAEQGFVEFTEQEIKQMPANFRKLIIINKKRCRLRKHASGKKSYTYEIRFRQGGYDISACGKTIELAKANMIEKMKTAKPIEKTSQEIPKTFKEFAFFYFENFRKFKVKECTYEKDLVRLEKYLIPLFGSRQIAKISPIDCKNLFDRVRSDGKSKTSEELRSILSVIFKGAISHGLLERSPLDVVLHIKHERISGCALTKQEETVLLESVRGTVYAPIFALALYTGLRPNEFSTAKIKGDFIVSVNSKRKSSKTEYKRIPICDKLRPYLPSAETFIVPTLNRVREKIKEILPDHKLYDLRTTFNSRCVELGVADYARMHFMGHSLGALGNAYTDLSDSYLLKEGRKLNSW